MTRLTTPRIKFPNFWRRLPHAGLRDALRWPLDVGLIATLRARRGHDHRTRPLRGPSRTRTVLCDVGVDEHSTSNNDFLLLWCWALAKPVGAERRGCGVGAVWRTDAQCEERMTHAEKQDLHAAAALLLTEGTDCAHRGRRSTSTTEKKEAHGGEAFFPSATKTGRWFFSRTHSPLRSSCACRRSRATSRCGVERRAWRRKRRHVRRQYVSTFAGGLNTASSACGLGTGRGRHVNRREKHAKCWASGVGIEGWASGRRCHLGMR